ncbi:MAG: virulence RhuM family protein [Paludibacteraceae bacterium]|nr:virulence RhuM family protein [Paludibacteraceae bacterium]
MDEKGEIVLYQTQDGVSKLDVRLDGETVWLTQEQMTELFQRDKSVISRHIKNIFEEGELNEKSVVAFFATTASDGKKYNVAYYNLDVIISVGYRVKSQRGVQFRQWATQRIHEYIVKGFALDDERLKGNGGGVYWRELLQRIQEIRTDERLIYRQVLDLYATAYDYDKNSQTAHEFFAAYQNKFHFAIHGHTASELIIERADATQPFMGMTTGEYPTSAKVVVAKNYMTDKELDAMRSLVSGFFDFAEMQAKLHQHMYMADYMTLLEDLIRVNKRPVLEGKGHASAEQAKSYALEELKKFKERRLSPAEEDYMETIRALNQKAKENSNNRSNETR